MEKSWERTFKEFSSARNIVPPVYIHIYQDLKTFLTMNSHKGSSQIKRAAKHFVCCHRMKEGSKTLLEAQWTQGIDSLT